MASRLLASRVSFRVDCLGIFILHPLYWAATMYLSLTNRQRIAIWLSAILIILSVAASAHSVEHIDEGAKTHCTLCFHQHQYQNALPQQDANIEIVSQLFQPTITPQTCLAFAPCAIYLSRAPPVVS